MRTLLLVAIAAIACIAATAHPADSIGLALAMAPFIVTDERILAYRRDDRCDVAVGDRVQICNRCGDWGEDNQGEVMKIASKADAKGRVFVSVLMDGMPGHDGKKDHPALPAFEAALVRKIDQE